MFTLRDGGAAGTVRQSLARNSVSRIGLLFGVAQPIMPDMIERVAVLRIDGGVRSADEPAKSDPIVMSAATKARHTPLQKRGELGRR
jgi:hypothetical protein